MISPYECLKIDATAGIEGAARERTLRVRLHFEG
jgi:hypothetical protein